MQSATSNIDWNLAKALRAQGLKWDEIGEQFGTSGATIRVKASRQGWARINKTTANTLEKLGQQTMARTIQENAPKLAEAWLAKAQEDTVESLDAIRKLSKPTSLEKMKQREEMMLTHVKRGRAAFGLDDQKGSGVQINIMSQLAQIAMTTNTDTNISGGLAVECPIDCPNPLDNE